MAKIIACYFLKSINAGCFYVGSTIDLHRRTRQHLTALKRGEHHSKKLQEAWDEFQDVGVASHTQCDTIEQAEALELQLIQQYHGHDLFCNVNPQLRGRIAGFTPSEETKAKMSLARTGEGNSMYGRKHTAEARAKIGAASKRIDYSKRDMTKSMSRVAIDGKVYPSLVAASEDLGILVQTIRWRINSKNPIFSGYSYALEINLSEN